MEKTVLNKAYHEFNDLFQTWFKILIEDDTLNIRLSPLFSPIVEQNGYEIDVSSLSGGEKTSGITMGMACSTRTLMEWISIETTT